MNQGILTQLPQPPAMPYGLLGRPTPAPMPAVDYALDVDAADYIRRVEAADGQALELPARLALDTFIRGCKADGIWNAIKASCILAGARTLSGALIPLVGTAPTNFNFVTADYNRKTGLGAAGSVLKYLNSNRNNNAEPQNNQHLSVYVSGPPITGASDFPVYIGTDSETSTKTGFAHFGRLNNNSPSLYSRNKATNTTSAFDTIQNAGASTGFVGQSRNDSAFYGFRVNSATQIVISTSAAPASQLITVFWSGAFPAATRPIPRLSFYSIGESLDLALLDARVTQLMNLLAVVL